jgi:SAM-dependent methyltransferase
MNMPAESSYENTAGAPWFENETTWKVAYSLFSEERFTAADEEIGKIQELTGCRPGRVLDLCCGPGRHSISLARRGFQVTGVDRSPFLLEKARARAEQKKVQIEWIQEDMRTFIRPAAFDLVINLNASFGYFETADEDLAVLQNAFCSLGPGGLFVIDLMGKELVARRFAQSEVQKTADGRMLVETREITDDWTRTRSHLMIIDDRQVEHVHFTAALYSGRELSDLLHKAGFDKVKLFGSLQGTPYDLNAQRLIAVAAKPGP